MSQCKTSGSVKEFLALVRRLQRDRSFRETRLEYFAEGVRNFIQSVEAGAEIRTIIFSSRLLNSSIVRQRVQTLQNDGVAVVAVSPEEFRKISTAEQASGIGVILAQQWTTLEQISDLHQKPWLVLGKLNSPGNLGTMIRSSECLGGAGLILLDRSVDPYAPATVRPTMGALFRQQFVRTKLRFLRRWMERNHVQAVGASPDGSSSLPASELSQTLLIMLGEERQGLTDKQKAACTQLVSIPMSGQSDSLNVSVACSLFLYERLRSMGRESKTKEKSPLQ